MEQLALRYGSTRRPPFSKVQVQRADPGRTYKSWAHSIQQNSRALHHSLTTDRPPQDAAHRRLHRLRQRPRYRRNPGHSHSRYGVLLCVLVPHAFSGELTVNITLRPLQSLLLPVSAPMLNADVSGFHDHPSYLLAYSHLHAFVVPHEPRRAKLPEVIHLRYIARMRRPQASSHAACHSSPPDSGIRADGGPSSARSPGLCRYIGLCRHKDSRPRQVCAREGNKGCAYMGRRVGMKIT